MEKLQSHFQLGDAVCYAGSEWLVAGVCFRTGKVFYELLGTDSDGPSTGLIDSCDVDQPVSRSSEVVP